MVMLLGGRDTLDNSNNTSRRGMGGGSGAQTYHNYHHHNGSRLSTSMSGPVDRVYHFTDDSHEAKRVTRGSNANSNGGKKNRNRARSGSGGSLENRSDGSSYETIDGPQHSRTKKSTPLIPPPPGLKNVGNSCYANAALQCLLSTALPHALLDERNAHIIRRHSFNRKLLVHGSGSVDSTDQDTAINSKDSLDGSGGNNFGGSCLSGVSGIYEDYAEEDDDVILARALGGDSDPFGSLRASPSRAARLRKRIANRAASGNKQQMMPPDDATVGSCSTLHSDMYHVMKSRQRKAETEQPDSEADLLCAWLTQELTQITREYTTPPQGFKVEKRQNGRSKYSSSGRAGSPTSFLGSLFGSGSGNGGAHGRNGLANNRVVDPGSITRHVHKISPCLRPYQQEDAHEFFRSLLSSLTMHGQNARLSSLFDGLLESSVTCQTCRKTSLTRDRYMDLSLDIADKSITTLEGAFEKFTEDETLCHDNMVTCSRCEVKRVVTKGLRLATAPTMLVINYKRFAYDNYGRLVRLSKPVHFPLRLEIGEYMSRANRGKPPPYTLVAVLVHRGRSCDCGHYFAYVRKGKDWYLANDAEVTKVDVEEVLSAQAYVLVYEVAGMKEKHNFDCYSRYHRSLDEEDEESMARGEERRKEESGSWDFSSLTSLLEACDAGLCGSIGNVLDTSGNNPARDEEGRRGMSKHSFEEATPPRKGKHSYEEDSTSSRNNGKKNNRSPRSKEFKHINNEDYASAKFKQPKNISKTDILSHSDRVSSVTAYYKRGRSHTPNRHARREHHGSNRHRAKDTSGMLDYEPPDNGVPRRAKSLSRSLSRSTSASAAVVETKFKTKAISAEGSRGNGNNKSHRRVPSRPRDHRNEDLPPLHEQRSGSSTRVTMQAM